jgi:hypothetical protein
MKGIDIYYFDGLSPNKMDVVAQMVSEYSTSPYDKDHGIAPVSTEEILTDEQIARVAFIGDTFAGYIRTKEAIKKDGSDYMYQQVGTLVVSEAFRQCGVGLVLVRQITEDVTAELNVPYAFCNQASKPIFAKAGYEEALPDELPARAVSIYGNQSMVHRSGKIDI